MNDESILPFITKYIKENFFGVILLVSVFLIIYFVDYINGLNVIILSTLNITGVHIPSSPNQPTASQLIIHKQNKRRHKSSRHK
jgi:hypothetical protein